jgi:hypothetical protein
MARVTGEGSSGAAGRDVRGRSAARRTVEERQGRPTARRPRSTSRSQSSATRSASTPSGRHRLFRRCLVTDAAAHAGSRLADLLDPCNTGADTCGPIAATARRRTRRCCAALAKKPDPSQQAGAPADAGAYRPCQREKVSNRMGPARAHHWPRPRHDQDRARQPRPQHAPAALVRARVTPRLTSVASPPAIASPAPVRPRSSPPSRLTHPAKPQ